MKLYAHNSHQIRIHIPLAPTQKPVEPLSIMMEKIMQRGADLNDGGVSDIVRSVNGHQVRKLPVRQEVRQAYIVLSPTELVAVGMLASVMSPGVAASRSIWGIHPWDPPSGR